MNFVAPRVSRRRAVARELTDFCRTRLGRPDLVVAVTPRANGREKFHVVRMLRNGNRIELCCSEWGLNDRYHIFRSRLCGALTPIAMAPAQHLEAIAEISDGEESGPGVISFCSRDPLAILVPDEIFVRTGGYDSCRRIALSSLTEWDARIDRIIWRGSTTGSGMVSKPKMSTQDPELLPRVRLCLELQDLPGTDVKISNVAQKQDHDVISSRLAKAGILGDHISPLTWFGCKFALDIDGNSNAWSNLFMRLLMGCCVLKIASPSGYRQWYYDGLEPWTHFVPVKSDFSDLRERIAWCRANLDRCRRIASDGQGFAMAHDFETEVARSVRRVHEAYRNGSLRTEL